MAEKVSAAITFIDSFKPNDAVDVLGVHVGVLSRSLQPNSKDADEFPESVAPLPGNLRRLAINALSTAAQICGQTRIWEPCAAAILSQVKTEEKRGDASAAAMASDDDDERSVLRMFALKKVVGLFKGQNSWENADTITRRATMVVRALMEASLSLLAKCRTTTTPAPSAPGAAAGTLGNAEARLITEVLLNLISVVPQVTNVVATESVQSMEAIQGILAPLLSLPQRPAATFLSAVEEAAVALPDASESVRMAALQLLPAQFPGRGGHLCRSEGRLLESRMRILLSAHEEGDDDDGRELNQVAVAINTWLQHNEASMDSLQRALTVDLLRTALRLATTIVAAPQRRRGDAEGDSAETAPKKPKKQRDVVRLAALRSLVMLFVYHKLPASDVDAILNDEAVSRWLRPSFQRLCSPPSMTRQEKKPTDAECEGGDRNPAEAVEGEGKTECALPSQKLTLETIDELDMCVVECQLITAKKLLLSSGSGLSSVPPRSTRKASELPESLARVAEECKPIFEAARSAVAKLHAAERLLRAGEGKKRPRGDHAQQGGVANGEAGDSGEVATFSTAAELKPYADVIHGVVHLSRFFVDGTDHKVVPSWLL